MKTNIFDRIEVIGYFCQILLAFILLITKCRIHIIRCVDL